MKSILRKSCGFSLIELMVALAIVSIGFLGFIGAFSYLSRAISGARYRTIASNLAQEKQEYIRKFATQSSNNNGTMSYFRIIVTTAPAHAAEGGNIPPFPYDTLTYPQQTINVGGTTFLRRTYVEKVQEIGGQFTSVDFSQPDTGMKKVTVDVLWQSGNTWYYIEARSLISNPNRQALSSSITGKITDASTSAGVPGVRVECLQDTSLFGITDVNGNYSFYVTAGTYTLRAGAYGYYTSYTNPTPAYTAANSTGTANFTIQKIGVGSVAGNVWIATMPVISALVANTAAPNTVGAQYIELYNPSPYSTFTIPSNYFLWFAAGGSAQPAPFQMQFTYNNSYLYPLSYYLFANVPSVNISGLGITRTADAVFCTPTSCPSVATSSPSYFSSYCPSSANNYGCLPKWNPGGVSLTNGSGVLSYGGMIDEVAWKIGNGSGSNAAPTVFIDSSPFYLSSGFFDNVQMVRLSSISVVADGYGRCYKTSNASIDFSSFNVVAIRPRNSGDSEPRIVGIPAFASVVTAQDGLSQGTVSGSATLNGYAYSPFFLTSVATGTTSVEISTGAQFIHVSSVAVAVNATTNILSSQTAPSWGAAGYYNVYADSQSSNGFLAGQVYNAYGGPLTNITVSAGGVNTTTNSNGYYSMALSSGTYDVFFNPTNGGTYNSTYVSISSVGAGIPAGVVHGVNEYLSQGGSISGLVTTDGLAVDPLPNVPVSAIGTDGIDHGDSQSGSNGYFLIQNLTTGTYTVVLTLDKSDTVTPSSPTVNVTTSGQTVFSATFTVTNAFGDIRGSATNNGQPINTGVLVVAVAAPATIGTTPPADSSGTRSGSTQYYMGSTQADGTYDILVRGGAPGAPTSYNVYAWYSAVAFSGSAASGGGGASVVTTQKAASANVTAGSKSTVNFSWP